MNKKFFITTAIDYTNDVIHIGHSYQKILADCLARYHHLLGEKTFFLTGTDEHGQKVESAASEKKTAPKKFVDEIVSKNKKEWKSLNISYSRFIRTTDPDHIKFAQETYLKAKERGDIYLGKYKGLYCEGCENYLVESDLIKGRCLFHPNIKPIKIEEDNYFFALSKYQKFLLKYIENHPEFIQPEAKRNEITAFIEDGLKDFSVSRQNVKWGIPVPDDPQHTIYVWFDALLNYLTYGLEENCWPADIHVLGKDNQRFHAVYWPAILKSTGYPLPKTILVHDFISLNGQKISKSLGNVIRPSTLVKEFGTDAVRYFFLRYGPLQNDVDISLDKIRESYHADLANGLGNLVARVAKMAEKTKFEKSQPLSISPEISKYLNHFRVDLALEAIWKKIKVLDVYINQNQVWQRTGKKKTADLKYLVKEIRQIAFDLKPFLPKTAEKIESQFFSERVKPDTPLFPRLTPT